MAASARLEAWPHDGGEHAPELAGVGDVVEAEAGVHEHEAFGALDQQAVADEPRSAEQAAVAGDHARAARAHGAAAEVVDGARGGVQPTASICDCSSARPWRIRSAARSATAIVGALVLPRGTIGITDASTTRSPSRPLTRSCSSTTAPASVPMRQVPQGW